MTEPQTPRNQGGRPRMLNGRKEHFVRFRVNDKELETLKALERACGMNRTDLIKKRVFSAGDQQLVNAKEMLKQLDAIGAELHRAGNNINQLARHANTLKLRGQLSEHTMTEFVLQFREYARIRGDTEQALRAIIRLIRP